MPNPKNDQNSNPQHINRNEPQEPNSSEDKKYQHNKPSAQKENHDPVCGAAVESHENQASHDGKQYYFCSTECKDKFIKNPKSYQ